LLTKGEYELKLPPPFVPGMETAGVVRSAPATSGFRVGERVSAFWVLGGYAERVAVPVANVVRSPAELDDAQAVSLLVNYNTIYFALACRAAIRPGDTVLVLGAAGAVGTAAIQIAKAMNASQLIAVEHREGATDYVSSLSADVVLPVTDAWADRVHEHTHGQGADIVVDPIGGPTFDDAIRVLAIDGKLLVIGFAAGGIPTVKVNRLLLRNVSVVGVAWGEYLNKVPGSAAFVCLGPEPAGLLGAQTPFAATLSVVGSPSGVAVPGRGRCARQAGTRAADLQRHRLGWRGCRSRDGLNDLLGRMLENSEFEAAHEREQCCVGGKRRAECIDQPPNRVTVDRLLYPAQEQVDVIGRDRGQERIHDVSCRKQGGVSLRRRTRDRGGEAGVRRLQGRDKAVGRGQRRRQSRHIRGQVAGHRSDRRRHVGKVGGRREQSPDVGGESAHPLLGPSAQRAENVV